MKEKELIDLGFIKETVSAEESGDNEYYYFTYDFPNGFCLISTTNDNGKDFDVEMFNETDFLFTDIEEVKLLINVLKRNQK